LNPDAYNLLDRAGLPRPKIISVHEIKILHPNCFVYLRGDKKYSELNKRVSAGELVSSNSLEHLGKLESLGHLRTVELSPVSSFGAVVIVENELLYGELNQGHISGLLHHGFCCLRFLYKLHQNSFTYIRELQSQYYSDETNEILTIGEYLDDKKLLTLVKKLVSFVDELPQNHITEIIIDPFDNCLFIDCKEHNSSYDYLALFSNERPKIIKQSVIQTAQFQKKDVTKFIANYRNPMNLEGNAKIIVKNQALLSHAFTYSAQVEQIIIYDSEQKPKIESL